MRKVLNFFLIIFYSIFIAGLYGILHDQITYSISNEYYTLFKFEQFGINNWNLSNERLKVGIIGYLATWWVGLILGVIYAIISLFHDSKKTLKITLNSIFLNIGITFIFGILGFIYGFLFLNAEKINWYIPEQTENIQSFINVGSIHNFGYIGGFVGLIFGIYFMNRNLRKTVA
ncbi:hypothetical protein [Flavobacterium sp. NRK F7]|uniref:hypothetical protein n=1 Tax=Flavobacterium sp. NRK F7 TaxID=2954930 RepID=UPI002091837A|nr:hypothetical protein [Flavobacterium sp. NRK F7]MCO6164060.1 hypothetical protein [Flavobacterium sp. NRK F7]MCO6164481.1 hypothetical protein [Flavobacterium sp. NRK F7]